MRAMILWLALPVLVATLCPAAHGDDKESRKEKPEKKEKVEPWVEIRTAHFVVSSDGGEKTARRVADQFEQVGRVFQASMPNARLTTGVPIQILAAHDGKSFAKIFPEFPADNKRRDQPPGTFIGGQERVFIALRTNVSGPVPYEEIYQSYARMVLKLSYHNLPPWLDEGYSNVFGSIGFTDKGVRIGKTDPDDLSTLFESPLLPLDLVMHVDHSSPYFSGGEKHTVFYAESRALVHFLLTDSQTMASRAMDQYVDQVEHGMDSVQAARVAFGDLAQLQSRLEAYVKQTNGTPSDIALPGSTESGGTLRSLSPAEAEARMGAFEFARGRREDGRSRLEEALMMDPSIAEAEQSLGFIGLQENHLDEADEHFTKALQLDPNNGLTYYGQGMVAMSRGGFVGVPVGAVAPLEKSVMLIPEFAPAWYNLSTIYSNHLETLQKALTYAQRAATLAPGDSGYQLQVAAVLERLGRADDARKAAIDVQASSTDRKTANKAGDLIARTAKPVTVPEPAATANPKANPAADSGLRIERKTESEDKPVTPVTTPRRAEAASTPPPPPPVVAARSTRVYSMIGSIADVNCASSPQVQITLKAATITMKLHADDLARVEMRFAPTAPVKGVSCSSLRGRSARVSYTLVSERSWDGEIQSVEFR